VTQWRDSLTPVTSPLSDGLYETLRTHGLEGDLAKRTDLIPTFGAVPSGDVPDVLSRHVAEVVRLAVLEEPDPAARVMLVNSLIATLAAAGSQVASGVEQLLQLSPQAHTGVRGLTRPQTPLSDSALLTNAKDEPGLGAELRAELESADSVDLLCAFVKWYGLRVLEEELAHLVDRGVPFRVLTTTYVGATERRALDELVRRFGASVKINYETQSTRLHAKAWLFRRRSGFDTAYVGSSNLSRSALIEGLEWNVRLSGISTPALLRKFEATFDSYWADPAFVRYDPENDADRLDDALTRASGRGVPGSAGSTITLAGLDVRPYPHQDVILASLDAERVVHDRHRNLVVAATGTGKTIVAALDYRRLAESGGKDLTLLFVAHRREILEQSMRAYREVMSSGSFGELYVGGQRPDRWRHVFASVQSLSAYGVEKLTPEHFDVVVVDEFHHAEANTYRRLLEKLKPMELLGLTATPERGDGIDVRNLFGGRAAAELRLWDALEADILVPFHYFGVSDDVDLRRVEWRRGAYDVGQLDGLYTGNDARAAKVLAQVRDKVSAVSHMRAIGFCVSVAHAKYMARVFSDAGIPSLAVSGTTSESERESALARLDARELNCLFAADLYNEGLDLPRIDTVLLLRPTQSATVFLQQLGRGLRRAPGKAVLTVLDFIGQQRREFRFDARYRALSGTSRSGLIHQIENGFPFLPSGSQIVLDRVAQQTVLDNVRSQLRFTQRDLIADVRSHDERGLWRYLRASGREPSDVYGRAGVSWTSTLRAAGFGSEGSGPNEGALLRRVRVFLNVDDVERAEEYARLSDPYGPKYDELSTRGQIFARMLLFLLWPSAAGFNSYERGLHLLRQHPAVCAEIRELCAIAVDQIAHVPQELGDDLKEVPLATHAKYRREEILAGLGFGTLTRRPGHHVSGVAWCEATQTDALLINLNKSEDHFSPNTMYHDYALNRELFHWESQNATSLESPTGRRYVTHLTRGSNVVLFVREAPSDDLGAGAPFICLGQADYVEHSGERPIAITWRLRRPMPADTYVAASAVAR